MGPMSSTDTDFRPGRPTPAQQRLLLGVAAQAIRYGLTHQDIMPVSLDDYADGEDALLLETRATFVTLKIDEQLRGCIGTLNPLRPLIKDVAYNASQAAFHDPRFDPLQPQELEALHISISILSSAEKMQVTSEADLIEQLRPGEDGLIIHDGRHRATFLPSVWQQLPEPNTFVHHLKLKAGLAPDDWPDTMKVERYGSFEFGEDASELLSSDTGP